MMPVLADANVSSTDIMVLARPRPWYNGTTSSPTESPWIQGPRNTRTARFRSRTPARGFMWSERGRRASAAAVGVTCATLTVTSTSIRVGRETAAGAPR